MPREFRFLVRDFSNALSRASVDNGEVGFDPKGYFWMENEFAPHESGVLYSKLRLDAAIIPRDLVFYEFRDLDFRSTDELLSFQRKYGLLTSIFRSVHLRIMQDAQQNEVLNPAEYFAHDLETIGKTKNYFEKYDSVKKRHVATAEEHKHSRFSQSSLKEASFCVERLQWAIDLLIDSRAENSSCSTDNGFVRKLTATLAVIVSEYFPIVEYTDSIESPIPVPLSVLLVAQLLSALCDSEAFHICQYECCNRAFQWKRNKDDFAGKRTGALYCCDDHQIRQKRINQRKRRQLVAKQKEQA